MHSIGSKEVQFNVAFVTAHVKDMQRSIDFYTRQIGLELKTRYGNEFAILSGPGITVGLHPSSSNSAAGSVSASTTSSKPGVASRREASRSTEISSRIRRCALRS